MVQELISRRQATTSPPPSVPPPRSTQDQPGARSGSRKRRSLRREYWLFAALAFPNLALIAVFAYWPALANLYLSMTEWDMIEPQPFFVGLENYSALFTSPDFLNVLWITLVWVVVVVTVSLVVGVALASLFNLKLRGGTAVSALAFSPYVLSGAAVAAIWLFIFDPNYGLMRVVFSAFGLDSPDWITSTTWALPALLIVSIWKGVGFVAIVYLAAMQGLPEEVLEAARLDGANRWQSFRRIVLPLLSPTTFFLTVTTIISAFQSFDVIAMMTGGGPANSTTTLSWFIYEQGFERFDVGFSAAASVIMFVILMAVTAVQFRFIERKVHY
ncbi:carbohydrate ABC transporter permease [Agromyces sp. NPDC056965]|uniref:carbohydrate ABC transporter permease n=1 Tax=Agromyces sp. NPDC056965 TaxID=3345983 RepID=UPI00363DC274